MDICAAAVSALTVAPVMTAIDTAIMRSQTMHVSFVNAFKQTLRAYGTREMCYVRPLRVMAGVYGATYLTANTVDSLCRARGIDAHMPTFVCTSLVNIAAIAYKDAVYAQLFSKRSGHGTDAAPRNGLAAVRHAMRMMPAGSLALFAARDALTIASTFVLKRDCVDALSAHVPHNLADFGVSLVLPMVAQVISTPLHIVAIDLHQQPHMTWTQRLQHMRRIYTTVCLGRMLRVVPAFGLGGFLNDMIRE